MKTQASEAARATEENEAVVLARDEEWISITELGSSIDNLKIKTLEEISLFSLTIKESEMTDFFSWEQPYMKRV